MMLSFVEIYWTPFPIEVHFSKHEVSEVTVAGINHFLIKISREILTV